MPKNRIYLCLAHMSDAGLEQKYIQEAFDTNWVVPLGPNVNGFEADLEDFVNKTKVVEPVETPTDKASNTDEPALRQAQGPVSLDKRS